MIGDPLSVTYYLLQYPQEGFLSVQKLPPYMIVGDGVTYGDVMANQWEYTVEPSPTA